MVSFLRRRTSEELIKHMVSSLLVRQSIETRLVESICEDFARADTASFIEMKFQVATVARGVWVHRGFGVSEGIEEGNKSVDLVRDLGLAP
jgi:hypothetical protein